MLSDLTLTEALSPECFADRWVLAVAASETLPGETKVLLLLLAQIISDDGHVSVPEVELAQILKRHRSRIAARIERAVKEGYLTRLSKGQRWAHAVYRAAIPEGDDEHGDNRTAQAAASAGGPEAGGLRWALDPVPAAVPGP